MIGKPIDTLFELTTSGTLVQTIDISAANVFKPAGLTLAPSSYSAAAESLYIVDRGVDNDTDPNENDGKIFEVTLPANGSVPPVAISDNVNGIEGSAATINVAGNDSDPNGNLNLNSANSSCSYGSAGCQDAANGLLSDNGDGTITYTPDPGFTGSDSFVYEICDTDLQCSTAVVNITVYEKPFFETIYVSFSGSGSVGGVTYANDDVLAFDSSSATWSMYFDGSDVGVTTSATAQDIDAVYVNADGTILFSVAVDGILPDVGIIDDSDIIRFIPTTTGDNTAGTFELYLDGSDVELTTAGEDIDAFGFAADGRLIISTRGPLSVTGGSAADTDLVAFSPASLGADSSGTWALYFDGSDVDLTNYSDEDVNGSWIDQDGNIYLTVRGPFDLPEMSGDGADIFSCVPVSIGTNTSCTFIPFLDGSANGLAGEIINAFSFAEASNQAPIVNAGADQTIIEDKEITFDFGNIH